MKGHIYEFPNYFRNLETKTWKELNPTSQPPAPRRAHTSFVYDDKMYIFGGWNGVECFNDMWYYDFGKTEHFGIRKTHRSQMCFIYI